MSPDSYLGTHEWHQPLAPTNVKDWHR